MFRTLTHAFCLFGSFCRSATLAKHVAKGVEAAGGEVSVFQVAETLSEEVLGKMHAPAKDASVPIISNPADLEAYDGIIFGSGTRYGAITAQLKAFFDRSGQVWAKGGWVGKTAAIFFSTASQGGGQETTALTTVTQFTHHGMVFVPSVAHAHCPRRSCDRIVCPYVD
jgi:NAD(P)H dehydrogenase (quinone)